MNLTALLTAVVTLGLLAAAAVMFLWFCWACFQWLIAFWPMMVG